MIQRASFAVEKWNTATETRIESAKRCRAFFKSLFIFFVSSFFFFFFFFLFEDALLLIFAFHHSQTTYRQERKEKKNSEKFLFFVFYNHSNVAKYFKRSQKNLQKLRKNRCRHSAKSVINFLLRLSVYPLLSFR